MWVVAMLAVVVAVCYIVVSINASGRTFANVEEIPHREVALLLGTSPLTRQGEHNYYFDTRIETMARLYHAGKTDRIIASGGNYEGRQEYGCNELAAMRDSLICRGIPDSVITLDYGGLRTINSVRNIALMGVDSVTLVSQHYHNERTLFIADHYDIDAIACDASLPS